MKSFLCATPVYFSTGFIQIQPYSFWENYLYVNVILFSILFIIVNVLILFYATRM